jgi:hypothetical protein
MSSETGIAFCGNIVVQFTEIRAAVLKQRNDTVTYRPIARQRLGKHIPAGAKARNRTSTATQRISKHTSLTTEAVFSVWPVHRGKFLFPNTGNWVLKMR